jgi:hypothetical protein
MTKENNIRTKEGYFSEYYSLYTGEKYQYQIWMKLESRLLEKYGIQKYKNIESFRMAKSRYEKELKI